MTWDPKSGPLADFWATLSPPYEVTMPNMSDNITANLNALQGDLYAPYSSYTPALTSTGTAPSLGSGGTSVGRYKIIGGNTCNFAAELTWGTSPTVGSGTYSVSLPVPWVNDGIHPVFVAMYFTPSVIYQLITNQLTASTIQFDRGDGSANALSATYPTAPVATTFLRVSGSYRCAT